MLKVAWSEIYAHSLPVGHRFPMEKYQLLPQQLLHEGTLSEMNFISPLPMEESLIIRVHAPAYWQKLVEQRLDPREIRKTGFPQSPQLVQREITIMQGTLDCARYALQHGIAMNIAGGTHHAFSDRGEGFCLLNDIALAAQWLLDQELARQILVVDLDVHQGNGTAEIFAHEPRVFTFSMHGAHNYPLQKATSDLDVGLRDGTGDQEYLETLSRHLMHVMEAVSPDFIFFQSGVDVLATDKLGRLGLSIAGCKSRDKVVLETAKEAGVPLVVSMGGGYSEDIRHIVEAHANTFRLAQDMFF
jgi:acetoin utilization deacetylase AcuC-like enzyme